MKLKKLSFFLILVLMFAFGAGTMWMYFRCSSSYCSDDDPCADLIVVEDGSGYDFLEVDPLAAVEVEAPGEMLATSEDGMESGGEDENVSALKNWEMRVKECVESERASQDQDDTDALIAFKKSFDSLSEEDKKTSVHDALNLLPEGKEHFLAVILMDENEPLEVLESIYVDLMNRPDEVKIPVLEMLKEIVSHPFSEKASEFLRDAKKEMAE